jgi:hypothetical protein
MMMDPRISVTVALFATLGLAAPTLANRDDPEEVGEAAQQTTSGQIVAVTDASGKTGYFLQLPDGTEVALSYGPSWFWGPLNPLAALVGTTVEVTGNVAADAPDEHASATGQEHAANKPKLHVKAVDGAALRENGKPPWAGGPKVVGEAHPGFAGWSKGPAAKVEHGGGKPESKVHGPDGD